MKRILCLSLSLLLLLGLALTAHAERTVVQSGSCGSSRQAGARGGSIIRGRGSANPEAEEFFNINVQPDKEVVLILVPAEIKDEVIKTVYKNAGLSTEGVGIVFSLPVSKTTLSLKEE